VRNAVDSQGRPGKWRSKSPALCRETPDVLHIESTKRGQVRNNRGGAVGSAGYAEKKEEKGRET